MGLSTKKIICLACHSEIQYTGFKTKDAYEDFMYCEKCPNAVVTEKVAKKSDVLYGTSSYLQSANVLNERGVQVYKQFFIDLEGQIPPCSCGGRFRFSAWVKCPRCLHELPGRHHDDRGRVMDSYLTYVEGAKVLDSDTGIWHDYGDEFNK